MIWGYFFFVHMFSEVNIQSYVKEVFFLKDKKSILDFLAKLFSLFSVEYSKLWIVFLYWKDFTFDVYLGFCLDFSLLYYVIGNNHKKTWLTIGMCETCEDIKVSVN